jgi:hypothetical protein
VITMLDEAERALSALLREQLPAGTIVRTEPPSDTWYGDLPGGDHPGDPAGGTIGLFLHLVRESHAPGAIQGWSEDRDPSGRVIRRSGAERQYDLCYLVTAWADEHERELNLLGCALRAVAHHPVVSRDLLSGTLAQAAGPVTVALAGVDTPSAAPEIWSALGLRPRTFLDLVVTAPVAPVMLTEFAGPPGTIDLSVGSTLPADKVPRSVPRPRSRITEGSRDGATSSEAR